jgi:hypothetical protein
MYSASIFLLCFFSRYVPTGPGGASLLNKPAPAERRFEGLLIGPNSLPSSPLQHLQICSECYNMEAARMASGQKSRLPGGLTLTDLVQTVSETCSATFVKLVAERYVGWQLPARRQGKLPGGLTLTDLVQTVSAVGSGDSLTCSAVCMVL